MIKMYKEKYRHATDHRYTRYIPFYKKIPFTHTALCNIDISCTKKKYKTQGGLYSPELSNLNSSRFSFFLSSLPVKKKAAISTLSPITLVIYLIRYSHYYPDINAIGHCVAEYNIHIYKIPYTGV